VLFNNYGDQGKDFEGVFSTIDKAQAFIDSMPKEYRQWYDIVETDVK